MSGQDNSGGRMNNTYGPGGNAMGGCLGHAVGCGVALIGLVMALTALLLIFAGPVGWITLVVLIVLVRCVLIPLVGFLLSLKGGVRGK